MPLQWVFGALLFTFFVTFEKWVGSGAITVSAYVENSYACWPYFQDCGRFYFLTRLPDGYSQTTFYVVLFVVMLLVAYFMYRKQWVYAHVGMLALWLWKVVVMFGLTYATMWGNYDYYDVVFLVAVLFLPHKMFFLRALFVTLYFLASTIKIHEGWVLGTYFTSLETGLPLFGNTLAPFVTNLVIFMQMVGSVMLLSTRPVLQRIAFFYFLLFHMYSGILVEYRYLVTSLPMLIILFGVFNRTIPLPRGRKAVVGWIFLLLLAAVQLIPIIIIRGDQKMTLEGNKYGLYMFEANHQCISSVTVYTIDGQTESSREESWSARKRCDPYREWFTLRQACDRAPAIARIKWEYDHSINGGPFYRIVDEKDACALEYHALRHNAWIKLPEDRPQIVGYPVKNLYH